MGELVRTLAGRCWLAVLAAVLLAWTAAHAAGAGERPHDILVVHSYSQEYPWTRRQHEGLMAGLTADSARRYAVRTEYLDTKRLRYDAAWGERFARALAEKYQGYTPAAIYVSDDNALVFALDHLRHLFPHTPVFFSGVNDLAVRARIDPARVTGVFERKEIGPNLELVRLIAARAPRVVVVGDASETHRAIESELRRELAATPDVQARFVADHRLDRVLAALGSDDERFVILTTLGALTDAQGASLMLAQSIAAIVGEGRRIVISMEDAYLHDGVFGGWVTSGSAQGLAAARLLVAHLAGMPMVALEPLARSPNEYLVDDRELRRSGLKLPPAIAAQATLLHPLPGFAQRHQRGIMWTLYALAGALIASLAATLVVVLRKNRQIGAHALALQAQADRSAHTRDSLLHAQRIAALGNWDWDLASDRQQWSEQIWRILGIEPGQFDPVAERFFERVHVQDRAEVQTAVQRAIAGEAAYDITHRILRPDGQERIVHENAEVLRDTQGRALRLVGTMMDVTQRERALRALHRSEETLRRVIEGLPVVLWMLDAEGRFVLSEGNGLAALGRLPGQALGSCIFERYRDFPAIVADTRRVLAGESFACTWQLGESVFETRYSPLRAADGRIDGAIGVAIDITERKRSEDRLAYLANYDPLTGLPNRSLFHERLGEAMRRARRDQRCGALLFVDLDNFKHVNDSLGHAAGDALLLQVAARLQASVRASDTVSRLGGDEFTVIVEGLGSGDDAAQVAAKILEQSALPYRLDGREVYVTASLGIALYPRDGETAEALLMNADAAMYRAKDNGRHRAEFFAEAISARAQARLEIDNELRGALARGEFALHYQPMLAAAGDTVLGFEALLRWRNARLGSVSPAVFIPVLEETGLIAEVGEWVLREACGWAAQLARTAPAGSPPVGVSVNLSPRQFRDPQLDAVVQRALADSGLPAAQLDLELTESSLVDLQVSLQTMLRLKALGVDLSIDDFGTGYSSLSYLKRFPVDRLKIDASFVRDVAADPDDAAIVAAIVGLARHLQLRVIAEGVETAEQLEFLQRQGCDEVQGYLLGRPMPADEAGRWLAARAPAAGRAGLRAAQPEVDGKPTPCIDPPLWPARWVRESPTYDAPALAEGTRPVATFRVSRAGAADCAARPGGHTSAPPLSSAPMQPPCTEADAGIGHFIARWRAAGGSERAKDLAIRRVVGGVL